MMPSRTLRSPALAEHEAEPSVVAAAGRAIEAGHRVLVKRIDLARYDILRMLTDALRGSVLLAAGAVLTVVGWTALSVAAVLMLQPYTANWAVSSGIVGAVNVAFGALLAAAGMRKAQPDIDVELREQG
jgi:hypothetical protein